MLRRAPLALALCLLAPSLAEASDDEWGSGREEGLHLEIAHLIGMGAIMTEDPPYFAGTLELAFVAYLDDEIARDNREESFWWGFFIGDTMGFAPQAMVIANGSDVAAPWATAVGGGLVFQNRLVGGPVRVPSILGSLLPSIGAIFRAHTATAFYLCWEAPFSIRMDPHVTMDVAFRIYAIDDWLQPRVEQPGVEPWNYVMTTSIGVRLIE